MAGRKRLTDEERQQYDALHSRAGLTEDEPDDGTVDDDSDEDDMEALVIRGPGIKKILRGLLGDDTDGNDGGPGDGKKEDDDPSLKKDPKPPAQSRYFSGGKRK